MVDLSYILPFLSSLLGTLSNTKSSKHKVTSYKPWTPPV